MGLSKKELPFLLVGLLTVITPLHSQTATPDASTSMSTLQINSRAVLVDVIVTDRSGKPITGLKQDAFSVVTEQGKPQTVNFFEEHTGEYLRPRPRDHLPELPPDVFSNFSPSP